MEKVRVKCEVCGGGGTVKVKFHTAACKVDGECSTACPREQDMVCRDCNGRGYTEEEERKEKE